MSPEEYAATPVERLVRLFAGAAKRSGLGRACQGDVATSESAKAEAKLGLAECAAIAGALRAKARASELEPLFGDEDPDVRMCASALLDAGVPALTYAAMKGVVANCSTREALARAKRARTPPPSRPALPEMSDEALTARFEDAAERQTDCRFIDWMYDDSDLARRNAITGELTEILREMKRRGALARLLPYLDSDDPTARLRAAQGCLRIAPEKAVATLEALGAAASDVLNHWRRGECLIDKL
jgi:hypothetical protein